MGVRSNLASTLRRALSVLPPGAVLSERTEVDELFSLWAGPPPRRKGLRTKNLLYFGGSRLARTDDLEELIDQFENYLTMIVAYFARADRLFVHAGVVGWRGRAIVLPGRSGVGKSTLVEALVDRGATYFSDEMAIFDGEGSVLPFPVPLRLENRSLELEAPPPSALPLGLLAVTRFEGGASWKPRTLSSGRAVLALLDNSVAVRRLPEESLTTLTTAVAGCPAVQSRRGEADSTAGKILEFLDRHVQGERESRVIEKGCRDDAI